MSLERFIKANLLVCPVLVGVGYLTYGSLPIGVFLPVITYVFFVALLTFAWGMSRLTLSVGSS